MPVTRRYECPDCSASFSHLHMRSDEPPLVECPYCEAAEVERRPNSFSITTNKAKAVDYAYAMAEQDFGMTDMNDSSRPGDIAAKAPPPMHTAEAEIVTRELVGLQSAMEGQAREAAGRLSAASGQKYEGFFQNGLTMPNTGASAVATGAAAARQAGLDPIGMLHEAGKKGALPVKPTVIARADNAGRSVPAPAKPGA